MKSLRFKITTILLISIVMGMVAREMVSKEYHEQYTTDASTKFNISNKYGKVDIVNTTEDKMTIDVLVKVDAVSRARAQEVIDQINIILKREGNTIVALTEINNTRWKGNLNLDIDYTIKMPTYIDTQLRCVYGGVTIDEISGAFVGVVRYGSLSANALTGVRDEGVNSVELAYCSHSNVNAFSDMDLTLSYSKAKLGDGNVLSFSAKYSDLKVKDVAVIKGSLTYGDVIIASALDVHIDGRYSDISAGLVHGSLVVDTKYGDLEVDRLSKDFSRVEVNAAYGDVAIVVSSLAEYELYAKANYGDLNPPRMQLEARDNEGTSVFVDGYVGSRATNSKMKIVASYGDIDINAF